MKQRIVAGAREKAARWGAGRKCHDTGLCKRESHHAPGGSSIIVVRKGTGRQAMDRLLVAGIAAVVILGILMLFGS
jgi:hypothetical protein